MIRYDIHDGIIVTMIIIICLNVFIWDYSDRIWDIWDIYGYMIWDNDDYIVDDMG